MNAMDDIRHFDKAKTGDYLDLIFDIQENIFRLQHKAQEMADKQEELKSQISSHLYELRDIAFKVKLPSSANSYMDVTYKTDGSLVRSERYTLL